MNEPRYCQQPLTGMIWIDDGEAGANRYPVSPGMALALFDKHESRFFIKSADISGMPNPIREFKYEEVIKETKQPEQGSYVSKAEFEEFENSVLTKVDEMMQKYISNNRNNNHKNKGE